MKILYAVMVTLVVAGSLAGCGSSAAGDASTSPPVGVTGVDTPKSVSVVTAN